MQLVAKFSVKQLHDVARGELIKVDIGGEAATAIVLDWDGQHPLFAVLSHSTRTAPFWVQGQPRNIPCASYGTNWALEPLVGDETRASYRDFTEVAGALFIDETGPILNLSSYGGDSFNARSYNLTSLAATHIEANALPFAKWRIWETEADAAAQERKPLFEYDVQAVLQS